MIRLFIADDHPIVLRGLKQLFKETSDILVVDEAITGQEVIEKAKQNAYDVILLDISMPGKNGLDVLKELKRLQPHLQIMVLSIYPEELYAIRVLKAGASGYLTKECVPDELTKAMRKVSLGGKYISSSLADKLASEVEIGNKKQIHETLSDREYQVMCMIARGKTVREIAEELVLSIKTINTYRYRLLEKTKMKKNAEIIYYAIKQGLVD